MKQINDILEEFKILHDARFISIVDDLEQKTTKLTFITEDNKTYIEVILVGVVSSRCVDWLFGNIVLDVDIINDANDNMIIDTIVFVEYMNKILKNKKAYLPLFQKIKNNELFLLQINPSYGAYFVSIVENIEINQWLNDSNRI